MLIRAFCEKGVASLSLQYKAEVSNITPFPDNDETISEKVCRFAQSILCTKLVSVAHCGISTEI